MKSTHHNTSCKGPDLGAGQRSNGAEVVVGTPNKDVIGHVSLICIVFIHVLPLSPIANLRWIVINFRRTSGGQIRGYVLFFIQLFLIQHQQPTLWMPVKVCGCCLHQELRVVSAKRRRMQRLHGCTSYLCSRVSLAQQRRRQWQNNGCDCIDDANGHSSSTALSACRGCQEIIAGAGSGWRRGWRCSGRGGWRRGWRCSGRGGWRVGWSVWFAGCAAIVPRVKGVGAGSHKGRVGVALAVRVGILTAHFIIASSGQIRGSFTRFHASRANV